MYWFAEMLLKHKLFVLISFLIAVIISILLSGLVKVNYDLMDYLPDDSPSTIAIHVMNEAFDTKPPNARVLVRDVSIPEALEYKERISAVKGVEEVTWLDDIVNIYQPIEFLPEKTVNEWYKDGNALFSVLIPESEDAGEFNQTLNDIRSIIGENGAMSGDAIDKSNAQQTTGSEVSRIITFLVPLVFIILIITTSSWFEPVLFLVTIGISVLINMGTNVFFGEISFITQASASVLQFATSMDYSIFLLHRFAEYRAEGLDVKDAMKEAMVKSFSPILASGITTIIGFGALVVMRFKIGSDMGLVLSKGILLSLLTVNLLLPVLAVYTYKIIDKTHHRSFLPSFKAFGRLISRIGLPITLLVALLIVPSYMAQMNNSFAYGAAVLSSSQDTREGRDQALIDRLFGKSNQMVILVPANDPVREKQLSDALYELNSVSSVVSYTTMVGKEIPQEFIPEDQISQLVSNGYSRMLITVRTDQEGDYAFETVERIRTIASGIFKDDYYLTGGSVNVKDLKDTVETDNRIVTMVSVIAIGLVILLTFRSLSFPLILLITIETSVWINLSFPYFMGVQMAYVGYMLISSIQLGATVDYAILFSSRYIENRTLMSKREAVSRTVSDTTGSILTSGGILSLSGFMLGAVSSNGIIGELGILIGRGAALSAAMVLICLPMLLVIFDKTIQKTTMGLKFYKEVKTHESQIS